MTMNGAMPTDWWKKLNWSHRMPEDEQQKTEGKKCLACKLIPGIIVLVLVLIAVYLILR